MLEEQPRMYNEDRRSVILDLFGSSPKTRVLDIFLDNPLFEFTRNEIVDALGMAKSTLYEVLPELEESGVVVETRKIGKASLYRLNGESPVVEGIRGLIRSYVRATVSSEEVSVIDEEKRSILA
jgi:DNA-binding transcriptional ArsR family regulator